MRFPPSRTASALTSPASGHAWAAWVDAFAEAIPMLGMDEVNVINLATDRRSV